jgi:hypothetical protein
VEPLLSTAVSSSVFHALQLGHLPNHLGVMPPQSVQVYWVFSLAMRQYYWINSQYRKFTG